MARFNRRGYCGAGRVTLRVLQSHSINAGSDGMSVVMKRLAIPDAGQPEVRAMNATQWLECKVNEQVLISPPSGWMMLRASHLLQRCFKLCVSASLRGNTPLR